MTGLLQQHNEIENLRREYQMMAMCQFDPQPTAETIEELVLEECEL